MFAILISAFNSILAWVLRGVVIKFIAFTAIYFIVKEFFSVIVKLLPSSTNLSDILNLMPDSVWYFLNLFQFPLGFPLVLSAIVTRFIIRRIPLIG